MTAFATYKDERGWHPLNTGLLWEYRLENFDWQKYRKTVAERVISMSRLSDWYAAFDLYEGIRGFRKIARNRAFRSPNEVAAVGDISDKAVHERCVIRNRCKSIANSKCV